MSLNSMAAQGMAAIEIVNEDLNGLIARERPV